MPHSMTNLHGRVALITGAGSADGIGFAIARIFYAAGASVVLTSTTNRIFQRQNELDPERSRSLAAVADLTHPEQAAELVQQVIATLKSLGGSDAEEIPGREENIRFSMPKALRS